MAHQEKLINSCREGAPMKRTTSEYVSVKKSKIHRNGIFAKKDIPSNTKIIEYVGEKVTRAEGDRRGEKVLENSKNHTISGGVYIFELNKRYDLDGNFSYNTAKWINHSCGPNCEVDIIKGHIWVISIKEIKKGEELTYNYGYNLDHYKEHTCKCGSKRCVGYIAAEEDWPKLKRKLKK